MSAFLLAGPFVVPVGNRVRLRVYTQGFGYFDPENPQPVAESIVIEDLVTGARFVPHAFHGETRITTAVLTKIEKRLSSLPSARDVTGRVESCTVVTGTNGNLHTVLVVHEEADAGPYR
jgi:hypothetical protein